MRILTPAITLTLLLIPVFAQQAPLPALAPRLVRIANTFKPSNGASASPVESVTLSIYREELGGEALWTETQNVMVDQAGQYSVLMGATLPEGIPSDLFASSEARWLSVRFNRIGEVEQSRVRLVSVPYALKAGDSETLGGRPASAYLLSSSAEKEAGASPVDAQQKEVVARPRVTSGSPGYIAAFLNSTDLGNSTLFQNGSRIGLGTVQPFGALHVFSNEYPQMFIGAASGETSAAFNLSGSGLLSRTHRLLSANDGKFHLYDVIANSPRLSIDSIGRLGVGNPTPNAQLDVAGDIAFSGKLWYQGSPVLQFRSGNEFGSNTGLGVAALPNTTTGSYNTAVGQRVLYGNTVGHSNTAAGSAAMVANTTGWGNTSLGSASLSQNTEGHTNTAIGISAMIGTTTGSANVAVGSASLTNNTTGWMNSAFGVQAMGEVVAPSTGSYNTALGARALPHNHTGSYNIAVGYYAAANVDGANSNNIHIGNSGQSNDANTIRIGAGHFRAYMSGIRGVQTTYNDAIPVVIDSGGQLGTINSSRRFKEDIRDMGDSSSALMNLRPVTYRYVQPYADGDKPLQYGLIAEEVSEVYPDLVARSADGQVETVKYQMLDSMLLNEVQRQQREIQLLRQELKAERERLSRLEAAVSALSSAPAR